MADGVGPGRASVRDGGERSGKAESRADVEGLTPEAQKKVAFFTRQYIDALAPTNFALTNPEVLNETIATGGQNLVKGLHNLLDDLKDGLDALDALADRLHRAHDRVEEIVGDMEDAESDYLLDDEYEDEEDE